VRPDHLFLGTTAENLHDHWAKVRSGMVGRKGICGLRRLKDGTVRVWEDGQLVRVIKPQ
jgi:hypothetical protein